jgi:hypothetical protein
MPRDCSSRATHRQPVVASIATASSLPSQLCAQLDQRLSRSLEARLGDLATRRIKHRGLKDRLVNIDRRQHEASRPGR